MERSDPHDAFGQPHDPMDEFDLLGLAVLAARLGLYPVRSARLIVAIETSNDDFCSAPFPHETDR
jgi:hypothetical protein